MFFKRLLDVASTLRHSNGVLFKLVSRGSTILYILTVSAAVESRPAAAVEIAAVTDDPRGASKPQEAERGALYAKRRCGFTAGVSLGATLGTASGYPNDALKVGREPYLTELGAAFGGAGSVWIGLALSDWLVFGLAGGGGSMRADTYQLGFGSFAFHVDSFPAYALGGWGEEWGLSVEAGLGSVKAESSGATTVIDSGGASRVAVGVFYEGIRAWKLSMGPFVTADMMWSPSAVQPSAWLGWRTALYAGPR